MINFKSSVHVVRLWELMSYCNYDTRWYHFPDSFAKLPMRPVNKLPISCQSVRPIKYMQYLYTDHERHFYLLGSGKLKGSPLVVFIITRAVYKTSLFKHTTLNCSWSVIHR